MMITMIIVGPMVKPPTFANRTRKKMKLKLSLGSIKKKETERRF